MGMSQMTSMLKDTDRNEVYNAAIAGWCNHWNWYLECIHDFTIKHNRKPYVLDIGCGTGLLSLQAARAGAEHVYACEMFKEWVEVAKQNVVENGFANVITVINKHSSSLTVKSDSNQTDYGIRVPALLLLDLERKCDILVSEILDTVLLGEGVLIAVRDAKVAIWLLCDNRNDFLWRMQSSSQRRQMYLYRWFVLILCMIVQPSRIERMALRNKSELVFWEYIWRVKILNSANTPL